MGVSFAEAAQAYTLLTVGDGLVTQVPALLVSFSAGMLVAKAGVAGRADKAFFGQLGAHPRALATTSGLLALLAVLPGLPMIPFLLLAGLSGRPRGISASGVRPTRRRRSSPPRRRKAPRRRSARRSPSIPCASSWATASCR